MFEGLTSVLEGLISIFVGLTPVFEGLTPVFKGLTPVFEGLTTVDLVSIASLVLYKEEVQGEQELALISLVSSSGEERSENSSL